MHGDRIFDVLIMLTLCRWIPESAQWLHGQGRTKEANAWMRKVATINKRKVPDRLLEGVIPLGQTLTRQSAAWRVVLLRSALIIKSCWLVLCVFSSTFANCQ